MTWARKTNDSRMLPFDAEPSSDGRWALRQTDEVDRFDNPIIEAEHVGGTYSGPKYVPHFATCEHADQHRRKR